MANVTMPQLGETVTEGTITHWYKQPGELIEVGEPLFEVSTDKVDSEVPSLLAGVLTDILVPEGDTVEVGVVLAYIDGPDPASLAHEDDKTQILSPVVRRLLRDHHLDVSTISGTGRGNRITRSDVEEAIAAGSTPDVRAPQALQSDRQVAGEPAEMPAAGPAVKETDTVVAMNTIRRMTGELMSVTKATSPHVFTAVEVDFDQVDKVRNRYKARWKVEEGSSLTYLPFICRAVTDALRQFPHINSSVGDGELIVHNSVHIAVAVDLDFAGLVAPVIRDAQTKRLRTIARDIVDLAARAKSKQLGIDDIKGGTFTITNPGKYGTLLQVPLINQPQVAILSTDGIQRKPVVVIDEHGNEAIAIRSIGVLGVAWDHRAFDGAYVAAFLHELRRTIETRDWETEMT